MPLYQGIRRGLNDAIRGFAGNSYASGEYEGLRALSNEASVRKSTAEAEGLEYANTSRRNLPSALQSYAGQLPSGVTPELIAGVANIDSNPDAGDVSTLLTALDDLARKMRAEEATDTEARNALIGIGAGRQIEPYSQNASGAVLNEATGALNVSNPIAAGSLSLMDATRAKIAAQGIQAEAAAGASNARVGSSAAAAAASYARAKAAEAAASLTGAREQDLRENPGGTGSDPAGGTGSKPAMGTISAEIAKLYQEPFIDEGGEQPVNMMTGVPQTQLDTEKVLEAYKYAKERGITNLNQGMMEYLAREPEALPPVPGTLPPEVTAAPAGVVPSAADIGLSPPVQPDISTGIIQGAPTPRAIPIDGVPHEVIGIEPDGGIKIRSPTGREGIYTEPPGAAPPSATDPLSQAAPSGGGPRRITGTYAGQPFEFTVA